MNPSPPKWYYVYLLRSRREGLHNRFYIGCTPNLRKRIEEHINGNAYSTRRMLPIELIYFEAYNSKELAFRREKKTKTIWWCF